MIEPEIQAAVDRFKNDGSLPTRDEFGWCRNPRPANIRNGCSIRSS